MSTNNTSTIAVITVIAKRVDYTQTPQQVISATGRTEYLSNRVVQTMPRRAKGIVENLPVVFFTLRRWASVEEVDREYEKRGLVPDPYAQAAVNEQDPSFADEHPNASQWGREDSVASYLTFRRWSDGRRVGCCRRGHKWDDDWWFAGVRK